MMFKPAARYPADPRAVFILMLSVVSALTALALSAAPPSLEAVLPSWAVVLWGILLGGGSLATLAGMTRQTVNGILVEQIGSVIVGVATIFYSIIAFVYLGPGSIQTVGIIMAWGVASFVRWGQLQSLLNDALQRQRKVDALQEIFAKIEEHQAHAKQKH